MANQSPKAQISSKANKQKSEKAFSWKAAKETQVLVWTRYEIRMKEKTGMWEVAFNSIQASRRHARGLPSRFPRIKGIRRDKDVDCIDTLAYMRATLPGNPKILQPVSGDAGSWHLGATPA